MMLGSHSASLNCEIEYYIFQAQSRVSLAQNRSQVKPIRRIHQVQIQATGKRHKASVDRLAPARQTAIAPSRRFSYGLGQSQNGYMDIGSGYAAVFQYGSRRLRSSVSTSESTKHGSKTADLVQILAVCTNAARST